MILCFTNSAVTTKDSTLYLDALMRGGGLMSHLCINSFAEEKKKCVTWVKEIKAKRGKKKIKTKTVTRLIESKSNKWKQSIWNLKKRLDAPLYS